MTLAQWVQDSKFNVEKVSADEIGHEHVHVRELALGERQRWLVESTKATGDMVALATLNAQLAMAALCYEDMTPIVENPYSDEELANWRALPPTFAQRVLEVAARLNRFDKADVEEEEKKSVETPSTGPGSGSP